MSNNVTPNSLITSLKIGDRFVSRREINRSHEFIVPSYKIGTIVNSHCSLSGVDGIVYDLLVVKMDEDISGCAEEWENCVVYTDIMISEFEDDFQPLSW